MELTEAIMNRRSIRQQKSDPVDDETVQKILQAGQWAPSWANTQTWRFIVVRDTDIQAQVADTLSKVKRPDGTIFQNAAARTIIQAPVLIVVCAQLNRAGCLPDGTPSTDKEGYWYMFDAALAMQNMALMAHSLGLGTVIVGAFDAEKAAEILEVPEGYCVVTMTPLGHPAEEGRTPKRKELSEIVFNDKFGA